jgi:hypothetical protein
MESIERIWRETAGNFLVDMHLKYNPARIYERCCERHGKDPNDRQVDLAYTFGTSMRDAQRARETTCAIKVMALISKRRKRHQGD